MNNIKETFLINMDKDITRLENVTKELNKHNISFTRIPGVNTKTMSQSQLKNDVSMVCRNICTNGMIGCAMSHKSIYSRIVEKE